MPKILIIEDDPSIRRVLQVKFQQVNYEVFLGSDGLQGFKVATEVVPDVIITDITMPGLSGLELLEKIKEDERTKNIPIIFLTQKGSAQDVVRGLTMGAADYLRKPFNLGELLARVEKVLMTYPQQVKSQANSLYFFSILESLSYGVLVISQGNRIEYANAKARATWSLAVSESSLEVPPSLLKAVNAVIEAESPNEVIQIVDTKNFGQRKVSLNCQRLAAMPPATASSWVMTIRDLTDSTQIG
ncbi:MAG: response regulator [Verrucomicrobiota bacterium]|nr:response regulator [Verrucomicrobiota bacterium]